jgi:hypothetical protein
MTYRLSSFGDVHSVLCYSELEGATPFARKIQPDELWLYKNPRSESYVPTSVLWVNLLSNWFSSLGLGKGLTNPRHKENSVE